MRMPLLAFETKEIIVLFENHERELAVRTYHSA